MVKSMLFVGGRLRLTVLALHQLRTPLSLSMTLKITMLVLTKGPRGMVRDASGHTVMPGLVDTHLHTSPAT